MERVVRKIVLGFALLCFCDVSFGHQTHFSHRHRHNNINRIRTSNNREYVNLHVAEVAEVTEAVHNTQNLRSSVDTVRASMKQMTAAICDPLDIYRSIDGSCNNLYHPSWGTPMRKQLRLVDANYDDPKGKPRLYRGKKEPLPSSRAVSQACFPYDNERTLDSKYSLMAMQWGQFLDHDITATPESKNVKECCADMFANGTHPDYELNGECFPIPIEDGDRHFTTKCMEFRRSMIAEQYEKREQLNIITAYIDASQIYGSSPQELLETRSFSQGLLKESDHGMLQLNASINRPCLKSNVGSCFFSGDVRVNEFPSLTSLHIAFHREHNRIAHELAKINPHWDDETLFQESRKVIAAYMQIITYEEFLPITLGKQGMERFGIDDPYSYTPGTNPEIINSFSTAAYRFGHSMIDGVIQTLNNPKQKIDDVYFRPSFNLDGNGKGVDSLIDGVIRAPCQRNDNFFSKGVSDNLFKDFPTTGISFDLPARNVQRGRDHGLPPYMVYRQFALKYYRNYRIGNRRLPTTRDYVSHLGDRFRTRHRFGVSSGVSIPGRGFSPGSRNPRRKISSGSNVPIRRVPSRSGIPRRRYGYNRGKRATGPPPAALSYKCMKAYKNQLKDVDLFVGGLSEPPVDGGVVGMTFATILGIQFKRLKHCDRFWYETPDQKIGFTPAQIKELKKITLARVLCDNTNVQHIQRDVFRLEGKENPVTNCSLQEIPAVDLSLWKEEPILVKNNGNNPF